MRYRVHIEFWFDKEGESQEEVAKLVEARLNGGDYIKLTEDTEDPDYNFDVTEADKNA